MKKENKNNYYNEEDKINFEKLNNFKQFKSDNVKNFQIKSYSTSSVSYTHLTLPTKA